MSLDVFHITCVTHNSRISERMEIYHIQPKNALRLNIENEIILTKIIRNIVLRNKFKIISFNICSDHIHFILVCDHTKLEKIIQSLKSQSSRKFNTITRIKYLWAQKFNRVPILSVKQLVYTMDYIRENRHKHGLESIAELEKIINEFVINPEDFEEKLFDEEI